MSKNSIGNVNLFNFYVNVLYSTEKFSFTFLNNHVRLTNFTN